MSSGIFRSTGGLPKPLGELMGLNGPWWKRGEGGQVGGARPPSPIQIGLGLGGDPLSFSPPPLSPLLLVGIGKGGRFLLGVRLPLGRATLGRPPPPSLLYIRGEGGTLGHTS